MPVAVGGDDTAVDELFSQSFFRCFRCFRRDLRLR